MRQYYNEKISYPIVDHIVKTYVPELQYEPSYKYVKMHLFEEAMIHHSAKANANGKSYERLEYLGDSVFHIFITEYLYKRYESEAEGFLTKLRIRIERGESMAELCRILELEPYIKLYRTNLNDHILEDVFEAFIGAFYVNFGETYTRKLVINLIERHKDLSEMIHKDDNYKDILLRYFHKRKWGNPTYTNIPDKSKPHLFRSIVCNPDGDKIGQGRSVTKKKAEQLASKMALRSVGVIVNDELDPNWLAKLEANLPKDTETESESESEQTPDKGDKKPLSVFNPNNKLFTKKDIITILNQYNTNPKSGIKLNLKLFAEAMTHRSYLIRKKLSPEDKIAAKNAVKLQKKSNERLQLLGDAVIHFILGEFLYNRYIDADEGFLTRLRCKLENRDSLYELGKKTDIASYVLIGQPIEVLHGRNNVNIIGGGFEAFVGALYLEIGLTLTKHFVLEVIRNEIDVEEVAAIETNYKDQILQLYNKNHWGKPEYRVLKEEGPDHKKIFTVGIYLHNKLIAQGTGPSKKSAEQLASKTMYDMYLNQKL